MEIIKALKDSVIKIYDFMTSLPIELSVMIGYLLLGAFIITCLISFLCDKKSSKEKVANKKEMKKNIVLEKDENKKETEKEMNFIVDEKFEEPIFGELEDVFLNEDLIIENVDKEPVFGEIDAPIINITNLIIDKNQRIDKVLINKSGVYLIFNYPKTKGVLTGDVNDEFLFIKKTKILNPINVKHSYIKKVSEYLNIKEEWIKVIIIFPKIKEININTDLILKSEMELDFEMPRIIDDESLYKLSDRFDRIKNK